MAIVGVGGALLPVSVRIDRFVHGLWEAFMDIIRRAVFPADFVFRSARDWAKVWKPAGTLGFTHDSAFVLACVKTATRELSSTIFR